MRPRSRTARSRTRCPRRPDRGREARPMATVTALRERRGLVAIELDGGPWRTVPVIVAAEARLTVGCALERERARALGRALRRYRARETAVRAIARRDHSRATLDARLERAGVRQTERTRRSRPPRGPGSSTMNASRSPGRATSSHAAQATCSCSMTSSGTASTSRRPGPPSRRSSPRPSARHGSWRPEARVSGRSGISRRGGSRRSRSTASLQTWRAER